MPEICAAHKYYHFDSFQRFTIKRQRPFWLDFLAQRLRGIAKKQGAEAPCVL
jgi:hypothetical protein